MTDYAISSSINRDQVIDMLGDNPEQLVYVITGVLAQFAELDECLEFGEIADRDETTRVHAHLLTLAAAIEEGLLT